MKKIGIVLILVCLIAVASAAYADTLYLKNGTKLEGMVVEETDEWVMFDVYGGTVKFLRSEINRIEKGPLKVEPPKPAAQKAKQPAKPPVKTAKRSSVQLPQVPPALAKYSQNPTVNKVLNYSMRISDLRSMVQNFKLDFFLYFLFNVLVTFFFTSLVIKFYIRLFGVSIPYGTCLWFLFKFNFLSNIISSIFMIAAAGSAQAQRQGAVSFPIGSLLAVVSGIVLIIGLFFWLANRDLEARFFKALGLAVFMLIADMMTITVFGIFAPM